MIKRQPDIYKYDDPKGLRSIYDGDGTEAEPWFLPDPDAVLVDHEIPLPKADHRPLNDTEPWLAAQGQHAAGLATAAMAVGQLDMLVSEMGQGAQDRLALREVEALTWAGGTPIALDEIGRDQLQARAGTDLESLQAARWALRRLRGQGATDDLRGFLGLHRGSLADGPDDQKLRLIGRDFDEAAQDFHAARADIAEAHCFTQGAFEHHLWRLSDLSPEDDQIEGAVWAARRLASDCASLRFVPMGQGARRLRGTGPQGFRRYLAAITQGASAAKAELLRVRSWAEAAKTATAHVKGDTPARIIDVLMARPLCSTQMVEEAAGVSRDTAERVLSRLLQLGVVREVTGGTRFRLWAAKV